jgi:hypothetical protein
MIRRSPITTLLALVVAGSLSLVALSAHAISAEGATAEVATGTTSTPETSAPPVETTPSTTETTTVPAPQPTAPTSEPTPPATNTGTTPTSTTTTEAPAPRPEVRTQRSQPRTVVHVPAPASATPPLTGAKKGGQAVAPSALTPPLPSALSASSFAGIPSFFINSFSIPPFLLPIYQAAGAAYGIPWQVLAAINEVETDYGRDLSVSSAGAEGWMQFLPSEWGQYGVDVNDDGFEDPYNPADAIFAAARYLKAAGGDSNIRSAVFSYNHSEAYVNSVMLRARLLGGTPSELLGAITGLTEARFPVYAASHYSDGFPTTEGVSPHQIAGTTIYSQSDAPVIAVQDGRITQISPSGPLGTSISLTDAYGNTYTYAGLGTLATLYPVLEAPEPNRRPDATGVSSTVASTAAAGATRMFKVGSEDVYLHPLRVGVHVIAGTVLGHLAADAQPHIVFQIRPAGVGAPLIDPKPILDSWVKLQSSSVVKVKGRDPFADISPTPGQALLESKTQLEQQVPREHAIRLASCERRLIEDGQVDRRVLATLAYLSASGLQPTVSAHSCPRTAASSRVGGSLGAVGGMLDMSAINGIRVGGAAGSDRSLTAVVERKLAGLQGVMKPVQVVSAVPVPGTPDGAGPSSYSNMIHVSFTSNADTEARTAQATDSGLSPAQWLALVARLGEVPDPTVESKPSPAAIPDRSTSSAAGAGAGN